MKTLALSRNWVERNTVAKASLLRGFSVPGNYHEAAQRWSTKRSYLPGYVQDARFDVTSADRWEIVRKSRYFEANNAIVNRLADLFEQFTVGPNGLQILPGGSDSEWAKRAKAWWTQWSSVCDLSTRQGWATIQSQCARAWFVDGEVFIHLTRSKDKPFHPRIQIIESHRVATPDGASENVIDGVEIDRRTGRPMAYHVRDAFDQNRFRRIPADFIVHIFEPSRAGQYRGLPFLYPVMNDLHDLDDLQLLENQAAKDAARRTAVVKTQSGEISQEDAANGILTGINSEEITKHYEQVFGAGIKTLRTGDEYAEFVSQRPSVAVREYWDYLTSKICAGVGISKLLVFPWSMQGTVTRADLDVANAFFRSRSGVLADGFSRVYLYVMGSAVNQDLAVADPPSDWRMLTVRAPRSVNVDVGRNSAAMLAEYKSGIRTAESLLGEMGQDWRDVFTQSAVEAKFVRELAAEYKCSPAEITDRAVLATEMIEKVQKEEVPQAA